MMWIVVSTTGQPTPQLAPVLMALVGILCLILGKDKHL